MGSRSDPGGDDAVNRHENSEDVDGEFDAPLAELQRLVSQLSPSGQESRSLGNSKLVDTDNENAQVLADTAVRTSALQPIGIHLISPYASFGQRLISRPSKGSNRIQPPKPCTLHELLSRRTVPISVSGKKTF